MGDDDGQWMSDDDGYDYVFVDCLFGVQNIRTLSSLYPDHPRHMPHHVIGKLPHKIFIQTLYLQ